MISKNVFWVSSILSKMNESNSTWGNIVVWLILFLGFLEELKIPKRHFEITWLLVSLISLSTKHKIHLIRFEIVPTIHLFSTTHLFTKLQIKLHMHTDAMCVQKSFWNMCCTFFGRAICDRTFAHFCSLSLF